MIKQLRWAALLIAAVLLVGTVGFHVIEGWRYRDGLYMTLITMTTIGYSETHPLSDQGRIFNMFQHRSKSLIYNNKNED